MAISELRPWPNSAAGAAAAIPVVLAAAAGNFATIPNLAPWYAGLVKPGFNPPNWLFGPVWTVLYLAMMVAAWRVLRIGPTRAAIAAFAFQLVLNAAWSFAFFGGHSPGFGLVVILALDAAVLATIAAFARLDRAAALLLVPYAAWIAFATALNAAIWILNRG
ncbi:MAG: tryptophan-rich sensory protein [Hyphomicrobiales bacterium]|nr:tryptophan-rich sensory protein [Hyphomicrobiales bacterium]MDE2018556.1 tryptophan-rich sensory protein [Hyphomicrobiales bacterium]